MIVIFLGIAVLIPSIENHWNVCVNVFFLYKSDLIINNSAIARWTFCHEEIKFIKKNSYHSNAFQTYSCYSYSCIYFPNPNFILKTNLTPKLNPICQVEGLTTTPSHFSTSDDDITWSKCQTNLNYSWTCRWRNFFFATHYSITQNMHLDLENWTNTSRHVGLRKILSITSSLKEFTTWLLVSTVTENETLMISFINRIFLKKWTCYV